MSDTKTIEFTYEELWALTEVEEEMLVHQKDWKSGDPHPMGEHAESASNKIGEAFGEMYKARGGPRS